MPTIDRRIARVEAVARRAIEAGLETGVQVAVEVDGVLDVDLALGLADPATGRRVTPETLFSVFSVTKGVTATALHVQVDRGRLRYSDLVSRHWPEFAANGKGSVTVEDVLFHRAGVPQMPRDTGIAEMCDWEHMVRAVAQLVPRWPPGTRTGYHAYTFGWIIGELVRRTDPGGRSFGAFVQDELVEPLGIRGEMWLGVPDEEQSRIAEIVEGPVVAVQATRHLGAAIPRSLRPSPEVFSRADVRRSCHPGAGGVMNARSLAVLYGSYVPSGRPRTGVLVSPATGDRIEATVIDAADIVLGRRVRRRPGFLASSRRWPDLGIVMGPSPSAFGHSGAGGSVAWVDRPRRLAAAIVKNRLASTDSTPKPHLLGLRDAINGLADAG